jgi:hypothetical protein
LISSAISRSVFLRAISPHSLLFFSPPKPLSLSSKATRCPFCLLRHFLHPCCSTPCASPIIIPHILNESHGSMDLKTELTMDTSSRVRRCAKEWYWGGPARHLRSFAKPVALLVDPWMTWPAPPLVMLEVSDFEEFFYVVHSASICYRLLCPLLHTHI